MSDKIKKAYDDDPTAGNDPSKEGYVAIGIGGTSPIGYSLDQIANSTSHILGLAGNLPEQNTFSATMQTNSTVATIDAIVTSYTYYAFTEDTETVPTSGTNGTITTNYDLVTWTAKTLRLYISSNGSTFTEVLDINGDSGITLTPNYNINPPQVDTLSLALDGTSPNTLIDITFTAITPVVSTVDHYELIFEDAKIRDISAGTTQDVGPFISGNVITLRVDVVMVDGRRSQGVGASITMGSDSAGTIGIKSVTVRSASAGGYESDEDTTPLDITLEIADRTLAEAVSVTVSTLDSGDDSRLTATETTNFTAIDADTKTFPSGNDADIVVPVTIVNTTSLAENKAFQFQIDPGSESANSPKIDDARYSWGYGNAVLGYINGIGGTSGVVVQHTDAELSTNRTAFTAEDYNSKTTVGSDTWSNVTTPPSGELTISALSGTGVMQAPTTGYLNVTNDNYTGGTGPIISYIFDTDAAEANVIWGRFYADSSGADSIYLEIDGVDKGLLHLLGITHGAWSWIKIADLTGTGGQQTINIKVREPRLYIDVLAITTETEGAFTPTTADETWVSTSPNPKAAGAGDAVDDPDNPTFPIFPTISNITSGDYTLSPVDGATNVATSGVVYTSTFNNGTFDLTNPVFEMRLGVDDPDGALINGVTAQTTASASFTPASALTSAAAYTLTLSADYIKNSSGVKLGVAITSWNITIVNTGTNLIYDEDALEAYADGTQLTAGIVGDILKTHQIIKLDSSVVIVDDPSPAFTRKVIRATHKANTAFAPINLFNGFADTHTIVPYAGNIYPDSSSPNIWDYTGGPPDTTAFGNRQTARGSTLVAYDEVYLVYSFRLPVGWDYPFGHKLPGLATGNPEQATHSGPAFPEGMYGFSSRMQIYDETGWTRLGGGYLTYYDYDANVVQETRVLNKNQGTVNSTGVYRPTSIPLEDVYYPTLGKWITVKQHIKMNTTGGTSTPSIDGSPIKESTYNGSANWTSDGVVHDGLIEIDILEEGWTVPIRMLTLTRTFRWWDYFQIDEMMLLSYFNNSGVLPNQDQDIWFTMPKVSNSDIQI